MLFSRLFVLPAIVAVMGFAGACCSDKAPAAGVMPASEPSIQAAAPAPAVSLPALARDDFNRLAAAADIPVYWLIDDAEPGTINPSELVVTGVAGDLTKWVADGALTPAFGELHRRLVEARRQEVVARELNQGRPTLVPTDLSSLSQDEKALVRHILKAAELTDRLHRVQRGAGDVEKNVQSMRPADLALFMRNNGPWCEAPETQSDPFCNADPGFSGQVYATYPADEKHDLDLCRKLQAQPNAAELMDPFTVVVHDGKGGYQALSITKPYGELMEAVAVELDAGAAIAVKVGEAAFATYLSAAAGAFRTNNWDAADEAWVAMNPMNSRFYLRIAADEVYWDLCQQKAGFHTSFALIDKSSLELQEKLNPLRANMENALAVIAPAYKARDVKFQMPDFIQIIMNAGDARKGLGATIGQSLPNWGSVVARGGSRTVVMTNLYQDPDSKMLAKAKAVEFLAPETLAYSAEEQRISLIDIILHEATHNLGPYSDFRIDGKRPGQIFGGALATVLEELKAQSGSWLYVPMLFEAGVITADEAKQLYTHALVWSFGHLSQGLFAADGNPKPYSQLSAVIVGRLVEGGALEWVTVTAADGSQKGLFRLNYDLVPAAVEGLVRDVVTAKATGDVAAAKALVDPYVTGDRKSLIHLDEIKARLGKFPRSSMVYQVTM